MTCFIVCAANLAVDLLKLFKPVNEDFPVQTRSPKPFNRQLKDFVAVEAPDNDYLEAVEDVENP